MKILNDDSQKVNEIESHAPDGVGTPGTLEAEDRTSQSGQSKTKQISERQRRRRREKAEGKFCMDLRPCKRKVSSGWTWKAPANTEEGNSHRHHRGELSGSYTSAFVII